MSSAIILAGNSKRFLDEAQDLRDFLKNNGVKCSRIIKTAYETPRKIELTIKRELSRAEEGEPVLLAYSGHGSSQDSWSLSDTEDFKYARLGEILRQSSTPVLVLNDCCHSGALTLALKKAGISENQMGVIASCNEDETCKPGLSEAVVEAWDNCQHYEPRRVVDTVGVMGPLLKPRTIRVNRWRRLWSQFKHLVTLGRSPVEAKHFVVTFPRTIEEPDYEEVRFNPSRWGLKLDEHFFPKS